MRSLRQTLLVASLVLLAGGNAEAKECKKGKKPCGDKCISAKKVCKEAPAEAAAAGGEAAAPAAATTLTCKKGKKPCGDKCIPAKKVCKEAEGPKALPPEPKLASASSAEVEAALKSQPGQATIALARTLQKAGDLEVDDKQRLAFRTALKGTKPPLGICGIGHVQLVRDCDALIGGTVTLPCYLAVDEMSEVCKLVGQPMPQVK
jgi:hypothetical protein